MIVFCSDTWQATNILKKIITNIYNSFVFVKSFTNFQDHFIFFYKFIIHHSICISWLDISHSIVKYFNLFYSNSNLSKYFLHFDYHERKIIYHRRRHRNLVQFYILVFINRNEMEFLFWNTKEDNATNAVFNKINKNVKINCNN